MLYAAIDVGSNSLRSLVIRSAPPRMEYMASSSNITRITQGLREGRGVLEEEALLRTSLSLEEICRNLRKSGVSWENVAFFATESLRSALNAGEVTERFEKITGVPLQILSGEEEAWYTSFGASLAFPGAREVFDLGGGSLEICDASERISLPLGAVRMQNLFAENLEELRRYLRANFQALSLEAHRIIGVGGTSSTLAMMSRSLPVDSYSPDKIHGFSVNREMLRKFIEKLHFLPPEERRRIPGLPEKRADIIVSGLVVIEELLLSLGLTSYVHSECDLLWGVLRKKAESRGVFLDTAVFPASP